MKLLWGARLGRPDVLRAITHLATLVSKWSKACDRMLHRLMAYVSQSTDYTLVGAPGSALLWRPPPRRPLRRPESALLSAAPRPPP